MVSLGMVESLGARCRVVVIKDLCSCFANAAVSWFSVSRYDLSKGFLLCANLEKPFVHCDFNRVS